MSSAHQHSILPKIKLICFFLNIVPYHFLNHFLFFMLIKIRILSSFNLYWFYFFDFLLNLLLIFNTSSKIHHTTYLPPFMFLNAASNYFKLRIIYILPVASWFYSIINYKLKHYIFWFKCSIRNVLTACNKPLPISLYSFRTWTSITTSMTFSSWLS